MSHRTREAALMATSPHPRLRGDDRLFPRRGVVVHQPQANFIGATVWFWWFVFRPRRNVERMVV
jgi:hypothetical protein